MKTTFLFCNSPHQSLHKKNIKNQIKLINQLIRTNGKFWHTFSNASSNNTILVNRKSKLI
jgi:hypothetical protein